MSSKICDICHIYDNSGNTPFRIFKKKKEDYYFDECTDWYFEDIRILTAVDDMIKRMMVVALREAHKDDFFSVPEDNPLKGFLETAGEISSKDSGPEQASLLFICKRLKLNYWKLSVEERKWLKRIAEKSDLMKNPNLRRGWK